MKLQSITNPITRIMFQNNIELEKQPITAVTKIKEGLNQPKEDMFIKSEPVKFELPKDVEFKKPVMATKEKPYCSFDQDKIDLFVKNKEAAIPVLTELLVNAKEEDEICEGLFIADRMIASGTKGMDKMYYSAFSRFNDNKSANVQSFLSGVYRRILVPDAFGPLIKMLVNNIKNPQENACFDPNESIGGAILEHIKAPKIYPL